MTTELILSMSLAEFVNRDEEPTIITSTEQSEDEDSIAMRSKFLSSPTIRHRIPTLKDAISAGSNKSVRMNSPIQSNIPLLVKSQTQKGCLTNLKLPPKTLPVATRSNSLMHRSSSLATKHTLEIQFLNKTKRFNQLKIELAEKRKPLLELYQNLLHIKKRLDELGKTVYLEEIKLISFDEYHCSLKQRRQNEELSTEVVDEMRSSLEQIPKNLMVICRNLLNRRALIVELLESITKSEIDVEQVSTRIHSLKDEGEELQRSLDIVIQEHQAKIRELVSNWHKLINERQNHVSNSHIEQLEERLLKEEKLRAESTSIIHELQKKLEDRRTLHEKSLVELNGVLKSLQEQMESLETDLETERKVTAELKARNNTNSQQLKTMKSRVAQLETEKVGVDGKNAELERNIQMLQNQLQQSETTWHAEKEEMNKNLKHQENLLQKVTANKNQFETRVILDLALRAASELIFPLQTTQVLY